MDMEPQPLAQPWEKEEEVKEETTLMLRRSKRLDNNKPTAMAQTLPPGNGDIHIEEEENKDDAANNSLKSSVYFDNNQANESVDGSYAGFESSVLETNSKDEELQFEANNFDIQRILSTEIDRHHNKDSGDEIFSCLTQSPVLISSEEKGTNLEHLGNKTALDTDVDLLDEIDQESTAIDVVRVLENQNTHDLYCPNCNSCITRRVILRRRKRKVRDIRHKSKHDKFEKHSAAAITTDQSDDMLNICSNDSPTRAADDENHDRQPDVFRCLSCFSLFIPTGNGFKLFRVFGDRDENGEVQNVQNVPPSNRNWFFSIFASDKRKPTTDKGNRAPEHSEVDGINQHSSSHCSENLLPCNGSDHPVAPLGDSNPVKTGAPAEDSHIKSQQDNREQEHSEVDGIDQHTRSCCSENMLPCQGSDHLVAPLGDSNPVKTRHPAEDYHIKSQQGGLEHLNSTAVSLLLEKPLTAADQETNVAMGNKAIADHNELGKSIEGDSLQTESFCSVGIVNSSTTEPLETLTGAVTSSAKELIPLSGVSIEVGKKSDNVMGKNNTEDDVVVIIETQPPEVVSSQRAQNVDIPVNTGILPQAEIRVDDNRGPEAAEAHQLDILKSIVYGGLLESITSLGVVTSAAAAGAATLDILAMGLANLMGGLFIVAHNLRELKNDHAGETSSLMNEQEDSYLQLLGRRANFLVHATVVVLSYLIFGLMPPVIYGFSFRKSDNRDLKIAAVVGSSLACIIFLAVGKVHVQKLPRSYMKTVLYYVSIGIVTSGLSYVVGDLIKKLLEKLNLLDSSSDLTVPFLEMNGMNTGRASY